MTVSLVNSTKGYREKFSYNKHGTQQYRSSLKGQYTEHMLEIPHFVHFLSRIIYIYIGKYYILNLVLTLFRIEITFYTV